MQKIYAALFPLFLFFSSAGPKSQFSADTAPKTAAAPSKVQIMLLGSVHFSQFHKPAVASQNFFGTQRQQELAEVNKLLQQFKPDMVMVEVAPQNQGEIDSLYNLYIADKLDLTQIEGGSSEIYQLGFQMAKALHHKQLHGVDYYQSTSQSLLSDGQHMAIYRNGLENFQKTTRGITEQFLVGNMSVGKFLYTLNKPETIELSHHQFYNLPAYVQNGSFRSYDGLNKSEIDTTQIGAEFISLFYERNLKIYSNILNAQLKNEGKRILLLMGQTHIGVLQDIIDNNPAYELVHVNDYLNDKSWDAESSDRL